MKGPQWYDTIKPCWSPFVGLLWHHLKGLIDSHMSYLHFGLVDAIGHSLNPLLTIRCFQVLAKIGFSWWQWIMFWCFPSLVAFFFIFNLNLAFATNKGLMLHHMIFSWTRNLRVVATSYLNHSIDYTLMFVDECSNLI